MLAAGEGVGKVSVDLHGAKVPHPSRKIGTGCSSPKIEREDSKILAEMKSEVYNIDES